MTSPAPANGHTMLERLGERLSKSSRVFLIGLLVACGIEVAVDWNSTLYEINVLRASLRQKGEDYVDIVRRAAQPAVASYDWDGLDELSRGLFDDEDVVYVRFSDALGNTLHDRLRADYAVSFARRHDGRSFRDYYRHQMERDAGGMLEDPLSLRQRIAESRHRDVIQMFTDAENRLLARFKAPSSVRESLPQVLYQDRLYDDERRLDRSLSYALGVVATERGNGTGVVLLALRHDRMNRAVIGKLLKGLGITLFFVCLILVQNVFARRAKLRLLELEAALTAARQAIRAAIPPIPDYAPAAIGVAFAQADRVGGTIYELSARPDGSVDLLLAVPAGAGVAAAFASVVLRDLDRRQSLALDPVARARVLLAAYDESPLARAVELLCARFERDGSVHGVVAGLRAPSVIDSEGRLRAVTLADPIDVQAQYLPAPLRPFVANLADGVLALFDDGLTDDARRRWSIDDALSYLAVTLTRPGETAQTAADEVVLEAVKRYRKRSGEDFFALVVVPTSRQLPQPTRRRRRRASRA